MSRLLNEENSDDFPMWRPFDLKNGAKGPACDFIVKARDRNTCDNVWTLPSAVDSLARVWRLNTTLVQSSGDGTELTSLVAPG